MSHGEFLKQMGIKIRKIRKSKKLSLRKLAPLCDLKRQSLNLIELGQKDSHILTLKRIADALEVDVKDFI